MPKLKQPDTLQSIVTDSFVEFIMRFFDSVNDNGSSEDFRRGVSDIKDYVRDRMPAGILLAFITTFKKEFTRRVHDERWMSSNYKIALPILMDIEIIGLQCDETILEHLDPQDMHRIQGITDLDLNHVTDSIIYQCIETCDVNRLTKFVFAARCTDDVLRLVTEKCPNLRVLLIPQSNITDNGLRALIPCQNLRVIDISDCREVSHPGLSQLLTYHDKLEDLSFSYRCPSDDGPNAFEFLTMTRRRCLSMKSFRFRTRIITDANLRSTVSTFPNLTHLDFTCQYMGNMETLTVLRNLKIIGVDFVGRIPPPALESAWRSLKVLLTVIGTNITALGFSFYRQSCVTDVLALYFINEHCPNIERLIFDYVTEDLVVPSFRKLKVLRLFAHNDEVFELHKFQPLLNLEILQLIYFRIDIETVKFMMLDEKFPKLARFQTSCRWDSTTINRIARENNLDFIMDTIL